MNPNRYRPHDDFDRRDHDDRRWEARDSRYDEGRSWSEGDGGRSAEAWRSQGRDDDRYRTGPSQARPSDYSGYGYPADRAYTRSEYQNRDRGGDRDYRAGPDYGRREPGYAPYSSHGYAPGAQIWEGSGPGLKGEHRNNHARHDFEPDYLHWREQQMSSFDRDYTDWRNERREKFSADFDNWRSSRPRVQAENPIVGDVADGGTGDASELRKR